MVSDPLILALETSCDETAVAITRGSGEILTSQISSQIDLHRPYGGVVPELASRNHNVALRPLIDHALKEADRRIQDIDAFAATAGPGLASSLLIGSTAARALALASQRPFFAINHMEGHLLSPFPGNASGSIPSCVGLIVSGGHTMLIHVRGFADYTLLGRTRDDAAGEAFDKGARMLGLPYPGGPEIDRLAREGNASAFDFPRSMMTRDSLEFSYSGLKTALLYQMDKLSPEQQMSSLPDLCASFQAAIVDVLVEKSMRALHQTGETRLAVSGGVSCNSGLRAALQTACDFRGVQLLLAEPALCTDNAAMIAFIAALRLQHGHAPSPLAEDINPNLALEVQ